MGLPQGGWILATSPCVLAWVYTSDSLLIKAVTRLWPIILYLEFYSAFSEQFINDEILLCKRLYMYVFLW